MPHPNDNRQGGPARSKQIAVLHIPHSSRHAPEDERQAIVLYDAALDGELLRMTDAYTDEAISGDAVRGRSRGLSRSAGWSALSSGFLGMKMSLMASRGMGVFYTRTSVDELLPGHFTITSR